MLLKYSSFLTMLVYESRIYPSSKTKTAYRNRLNTETCMRIQLLSIKPKLKLFKNMQNTMCSTKYEHIGKCMNIL